MKSIEKLKEITNSLKICGFDNAEKEAERLIRHGLDINTVELYRDNPELTKEQIKKVKGLLKRRLGHEPLQYIVGNEEFIGLKIMVMPGILIPRPETEFMAGQALRQLTVNSSRFTVLDLCTGSGCVGLAIAKEFPDSEVYGTDISETAIECAKKNAMINGINNINFAKGPLFQPIEKMAIKYSSPFTFDFIIANPPYIKTDDIKDLQPEIKDWEPMTALNGGVDGLNFYRELIPDVRTYLKDDGLIMLEIGYGQSNKVAGIFESSGYTKIEITKDYAGIERIITARWKR